MILDRETIYGAFWAKVITAKDRITGLSPFVTMSRRLRHWNNVPPEEQPAMFMVTHLENPRPVKGIPPTWVLTPELFVYHDCGGNSDAIPGIGLSSLLDAIDDALAPLGGPGGRQTLGNLVSHCWISGTIQRFEGFEGMMNQSVAIIPIEIKVPDASGPV